MKKYLISLNICFIVLIFSFNQTKAQTGTDFWFAVPSVTNMHVPGYPVHLMIASFGQSSTVTISVPANPSFTNIVVNIAANNIQMVDLTPFKNSIEDNLADSVLNKGIYIHGTYPITAYYEVGPNTNNREIFALKGTNALGNDFYIPSQTLWANGNTYNDARAGFDIVATENETVVEITPTSDCIDYSGKIIHPAGTPFTVKLNKGQTFNVRNSTQNAGTHFGGTHVTSNKPIAITIMDDSIQIAGCKDIIGDQIVPVNMTGKEYIIVKGALNNPASPVPESIYLCATEDNTTVTVSSSVVTTLNKGQTYTYPLTGAVGANIYLVASKPIYVYQLTGETGCEAGSALLPSIKCTGSRDVAFTRSSADNFELILITKKKNISGFQLNVNGTVVPFDTTGFKTVADYPEYSTARILYSTAIIPENANCIISNTKGVFHMGLNNGSAGGGGEYGYFSNFNVGISGKTTVNTTKYASCEVVLGVIPGATFYHWYDANSVIMPENEGKDTIRFTITDPKKNIQVMAVYPNDECGGIDSITFVVKPTKPIAGFDKILCASGTDSVRMGFDPLKSLTPTATFKWFNGNKKDTAIYVKNPGTYPVYFWDGKCLADSGIYKVNYFPKPLVKLPNDTTICNGNPITIHNLRTNPSGMTYLWSTNEITQTITPSTLSAVTSSKTFTLTITNQCKESASGAMKITIMHNVVSQTENHYVSCGTDLSVDLTGKNFIKWYSITNNVKTLIDTVHSVIHVMKPITNVMALSSAGICIDTNYFTIVYSKPIAGFEKEICGNVDSVRLGFNPLSCLTPTATFVWFNGNSKDTVVYVKKSGKYIVYFREGSCMADSGIYNVKYPPKPMIDLLQGQSICPDVTILLNAGLQEGMKYKWSTFDTLPQITVALSKNAEMGPNTYSVTVTNRCLRDTSTSIVIEYVNCEIEVPNVITPNGDGVNDYLFIKDVERLEWEVIVYNRWGNKVYENKNYKNDISSGFTGKGLAEGVYYYVAQNKLTNTTKKGYLQLIR